MKREHTGHYEITWTSDEVVRAFIPAPLPPVPALDIASLQSAMAKAHLALGRLDGLALQLPDAPLFLYSYVRKEAVLSSQIEGTQSSLSDLMLFEMEEAPGVPIDDVVEVSNYARAMEHGLRRIRGDFPLSNCLIREIHGELLSRGRGSDKLPGEFRRSQNWIGGSRPGTAYYVPPPHNAVQDCMGELEKFLHTQDAAIPPLVRAGLSHAQFESIHPFLDGNGRVGRLLIALLLVHDGVLREPMLYLSLYFKQHRQTYYELLNGLRDNGDWEEWLLFFLEGAAQTAERAAFTARQLLDLFKEDASRIQQQGRTASSALRVHSALQERPIISLQEAGNRAGLATTATTTGMRLLEELGIAREITGQARDRRYSYQRYIEILSEGTEPL